MQRLIIGEGHKDLVDVTLPGGVVITATDHHPFWDVTTGKWTNSTDLRVGDQLREPDGRLLTVASLRRYSVDHKRVFNLTVADVHTYYAGTTPVLVHNSGACPNPYGRVGGPAHQAGVQDVISDIEGRGLVARTEVGVDIGPGGFKGTRFADVGAYDPADVGFEDPLELHQVGRQTQGGPVMRERQAIWDLINNVDRLTSVYFKPYNGI